MIIFHSFTSARNSTAITSVCRWHAKHPSYRERLRAPIINFIQTSSKSVIVRSEKCTHNASFLHVEMNNRRMMMAFIKASPQRSSRSTTTVRNGAQRSMLRDFNCLGDRMCQHQRGSLAVRQLFTRR